MNLLALVLAGHFIGDILVQTDWQAKNKGHSWWAMYEHMLGYHLTMLLLLLFGGFGQVDSLVILVVSLVTHSFIDRRWPVRWLMEHTGSAEFADTWGFVVTDQALHLSILCLTVVAVA